MERFIGRERELSRLGQLLEEGGAIVVRGEPGTGKTALVEHALADVSRPVLRATGSEGTADLPYAALFDVVEPLRATWSDGPEFAPLRQALGVERSSDQLAPLALEQSVLAVLDRHRGVVVAVDDAPWVDAESARILARVARSAGRLAIAMIFTARPGGFDRYALPELELHGLEPAEAVLLLRDIEPALRDTVVRSIVAASDGNPLGLVELPRSLSSAQRAGDDPVDLPINLTERLMRAFGERIRAFPSATRIGLAAAAIADPADASVLPDILATLRLQGDALAPAERDGLVRIGAEIRFRHPLVRAAAAAATASEVRAVRLALAAATTDESRALWYRAQATAGRDDELARQLDAAATDAMHRIAFSAESRLRAEAARVSSDSAAKADRFVRAAMAAMRSGAYDRGGQLLDAAEAADPRVGSSTKAMVVRYRLGATSGRYQSLLAISEAAVSAADDADDADAVRAYRFAATRRLMIGDPRHAVPHAESALLRAGADPRLTFIGREAAAMTFTQAGRVPEAIAHAVAAIDLADRGFGDPDLISTLGVSLGWLELYAEGERLLDREVDRHRAAGNDWAAISAAENLSVLLRRCGRLRAAEARATTGLELAQTSGDLAQLPLNLAALGHARALLGAAGALELCRDAFGHDTEIGTTVYTVEALAQAQLVAGDPEGAVRTLETVANPEAAGYLEPNETRIGGLLLDALIGVDRPDDARVILGRFADSIERGTTRWTRMTHGRVAGLLAGDVGASEMAFDRALDAWTPADGPVERGRIELDRGRVLRRNGQRSEARMWLTRAHERLVNAGARPFAALAAAEIGATAPRLRPRRPVSVEPLTPREREIAARAAGGWSDKEIATALFVSPRTVDFHLRNVFRKVGVRNRAELTSHVTAIRRPSEPSTA